MKKLLFMCINMNIGGTEKALLNMIAEIPNDKYEVTILMLERYGGFLNEIPEWVKVKYLNNYSEIKPILNNPPQNTIKEFIKKGCFIKAFNIAVTYYISKMLKNKNIFFKYILSDYPKLKEEYDLAVAYAGPMDFITYYVLNRINAKKKAQWIHFDIDRIGFDKDFAEKNYKKFNKIFVVSEEGKNKLINVVPEIKKKTEVFYNILPTEQIKLMSKRKVAFIDEFYGVRILTVGRISKEKGQDIMIPIIARLKREGYKLKWYCIGEGAFKEKCEELINGLNVKEECNFLGSKLNPYPYMKECDIYVQPSRYEGYCTTVSEVKLFNKPIVFTNVNGASEQIKNGETGLLSECNQMDIYINIKKLLDDKRLQEKIINNLSKEAKKSNEIKQLFKII